MLVPMSACLLANIGGALKSIKSPMALTCLKCEQSPHCSQSVGSGAWLTLHCKTLLHS
jgi:hypothetical protein